jgi:hypothetical protein
MCLIECGANGEEILGPYNTMLSEVNLSVLRTQGYFDGKKVEESEAEVFRISLGLFSFIDFKYYNFYQILKASKYVKSHLY